MEAREWLIRFEDELLRNEQLRLQYPESENWDFNSKILLYRAILQNDVAVIKDLLKTGIDVNAEISFGAIPLLMALKLDNFEAVKVLLDADADVSVTDALTGKNALNFLFTQSNAVFAYLVSHLTDNLNRSNLGAEKLADLLINSQSSFYNVLDFIYSKKEIDLRRVFIKRLVDWDVVSEEELEILEHAFFESNMEYLQVLLDSKIDVQVREKFGIDLRASIFGNRRVDAVELLENQIFNVNASGTSLRTALHFAAVYDVIKNVQFLLDSGAHVDIQDIDGMTPLLLTVYCNNINIGQLLLDHGADVQMTDKSGLTIFEIAHHINSPLVELLIAQLAISGVQGLPIKQSIQDIITSNEEYTNIYEACCQQLQLLKTCDVVRPITLKLSETCEIIKPSSLFTVLTEKIEILCRYIRNQDIVPVLEQHKNEHELHLLYYSTLKKKLIKASKLYCFSYDIADIISESTEKLIDFDHLVVRKICEYLSQKDIDEFLKYSIY